MALTMPDPASRSSSCRPPAAPPEQLAHAGSFAADTGAEPLRLSVVQSADVDNCLVSEHLAHPHPWITVLVRRVQPGPGTLAGITHPPSPVVQRDGAGQKVQQADMVDPQQHRRILLIIHQVADRAVEFAQIPAPTPPRNPLDHEADTRRRDASLNPSETMPDQQESSDHARLG
ncbi:hypothetical protein [Streptomyces olivaceoviridis]|uniref:hypothetical protein n=1 Tax=Streptomyces olivaceoviridis TaxID=1921 RepID=UPI0036ABCFD2